MVPVFTKPIEVAWHHSKKSDGDSFPHIYRSLTPHASHESLGENRPTPTRRYGARPVESAVESHRLQAHRQDAADVPTVRRRVARHSAVSGRPL